jgi:hypothetical protein
MPLPPPATATSPNEPRHPLLQRLDAALPALAGYPVLPLVQGWLAAPATAGPLLQRALASWLVRLDRDIDDFPPDDTPTLATLKRRLIDARGAMAELLAATEAAQVCAVVARAGPRASAPTPTQDKPWPSPTAPTPTACSAATASAPGSPASLSG